MGMDLLPERAGVDAFHANWSGWRCLCELLVDLGADVSSMAGGNDGELVDEVVSADWGRRIRAALDGGGVVEVLVRDASYAGGVRSHLRTAAGQVSRPVLAGRDGLAPALAFVCERAHLDAELYVSVRAAVGGVGVAQVRQPGDATLRWLAEAAGFFASSGGFRQW